MRSFKSNENIHKKEGGSYYVVSANKAWSVTLQFPGNESQRKHTAILRISNRQSIEALVYKILAILNGFRGACILTFSVQTKIISAHEQQWRAH